MKKALLLGAGFSYELGMPLVGDVTKALLDIFENESAVRRFAQNIANHNPYGDDRPINKQAIIQGVEFILQCTKDKNDNYEDILSKMDNIKSNTQSDRDSYHYLNSFLYGFVYEILAKYQIISYQLFYKNNYPFYSEFRNLFSDAGSTWVFSLNHDLYAECLALDLGLPVSFGDSVSKTIRFYGSDEKEINFTTQNSDSLLSKEYFSAGVNIVKLHGGLNEFIYDDKILLNQSLSKKSSLDLINEFQLIQSLERKDVRGGGRDMFVRSEFHDVDILRRSMLTGGAKFSRTGNKKIGEEKLQLLEDILKNDVDELTIIGYGFNDFHINFRLSNAMLLNDKLKIIIVDPMYRDGGTIEILHQFQYNRRIREARCKTTDWLHYVKEEKWYPSEICDNRDSLNKKLRQITSALVKQSLFRKD